MSILLPNKQKQLAFLEQLIQKRNELPSRPEIAIPSISKEFESQHYADHVLDKTKNKDECLIVDLYNLDCMTFLEYTEAIRRSPTKDNFFNNLRNIRYLDGNISYTNRRHFFTTWANSTQAIVNDVTTICGCEQTEHKPKILNIRADGSVFLTSVLPIELTISYIPIKQINDVVISCIRGGDYIGIYSPITGLDVSHVGLMVWDDGQPFFRHASSLDKCRQVVDHPFFDYLQGKFSGTGRPRPGIIIYRAQESN